MTAEVAVMSPLGVALAADSAVSIGDQKIYTSAEKLFQLSEAAPVGVMVHDNAQFLGMPWETTIKEFRRHIGSQTYATAAEYAAKLLEFITANDMLFPEGAVNEFVGKQMYRMARWVRGKNLVDPNVDPDETTANIDQLQAWLVDSEARVAKGKLLESLHDQEEGTLSADIISRYGGSATEPIELAFGEQVVPAECRDAIKRHGFQLMLRGMLFDADSGLTVAGFGDAERYPSLTQVNVVGLLLRKMLHRGVKTVHVHEGPDGAEASDSWIVPIAQAEMVYTFIRGIEPELRSFIDDCTDELVRGVFDAILEDLKGKAPEIAEQLREEVSPHIETMLTGLSDRLDRRIHSYYVSPVMDMISALPKDELASVAESLVNLTKFKRRVSRQKETVGGPIDVAVITRGDGFVWVKRKHYFEPELNPRVIARYGRLP
jgi:hypothetical protein